MDTAMQLLASRYLRARRFDRLTDLLADLYAADPSRPCGLAFDVALRCQHVVADLQTLRATVDDLDREIDREVRGLHRILGLDLPSERSVLHRWLRRSRQHTREPVTPAVAHAMSDDAVTVTPPGTRQIAAYGFGAFDVLIESAPVTAWASRRGQAVLEVLLLHHDRPVHREELMAALWPGIPYQRARNRLNVAVHGLRSSMRKLTSLDLIVFRDGSYGISREVDVWFDATEFEDRNGRGRRHRYAGYLAAAMSEFRRAVALYTGDLFEADRSSDWADSRRRRLRALHREMLDELGEQALHIGDLLACLQWSETLLEVEPWHEGAHARLMRVHARRGQPHLAIRQFVDCVRVLRVELEAMPSRPVVELYEQIKRGVAV
jgi:DNA-binding SARP family transcriptional activator